MRLGGASLAESGPTYGLVRVGGLKLPICSEVEESKQLGGERWQETISTDEVCFGRHMQLRWLAKKVANFLHEYHGDLFPSLNLPRLPSDRSRVNVHAMLEPLHIARLLRRLQVSNM